MVTPITKPSREQRIRDEFARVGPMSTRAFAQHCLTYGIWSAEERDEFELAKAQAEVRKALKGRDEHGLPFAGRTTTTEEGSGVWAVRQAWLFEDYELNISELAKQRDTLHWEATGLADECRDRYGRAPAITWPGDVSQAAD